VAPEEPVDEPLARDVVDALVELPDVLPQPLSNATEQMSVTPTDDRQWERIPDSRRLMRPTRPDPDETAMSIGIPRTGDVFSVCTGRARFLVRESARGDGRRPAPGHVRRRLKW
jgi:hypothetical protein